MENNYIKEIGNSLKTRGKLNTSPLAYLKNCRRNTEDLNNPFAVKRPQVASPRDTIIPKH